MTREEAKEILSRPFNMKNTPQDVLEAHKIAIKALEQEPCEDYISREKAKQFLYKRLDIINDDELYDIFSRIIDDMYNELPFVEREPKLNKIRAEILDEAEYAYADFDKYKEDILHAEPDELPDDDFRFGMKRAVEIIDKYRTESEK